LQICRFARCHESSHNEAFATSATSSNNSDDNESDNEEDEDRFEHGITKEDHERLLEL